MADPGATDQGAPGPIADLAARDHEAFTRPSGRPEYRQRRLLAVLAQGAARHYLDCLAGHDPRSRTGVKDLDVWTFYAAIPGSAFPAARRETHADFGPSSLGRQSYDLASARTAREHRRRHQPADGRNAERHSGAHRPAAHPIMPPGPPHPQSHQPPPQQHPPAHRRTGADFRAARRPGARKGLPRSGLG